jgi:hypothetical protein
MTTPNPTLSFSHLRPNPALALQLAKKQRPELVYDAVNLDA